MVCLQSSTIKLNGQEYPIIKFDCWWVVLGKGLYTTLREALEVSTTIFPAPVAIAENGMYEVLPPEIVQ